MLSFLEPCYHSVNGSCHLKLLLSTGISCVWLSLVEIGNDEPHNQPLPFSYSYPGQAIGFRFLDMSPICLFYFNHLYPEKSQQYQGVHILDSYLRALSP